MHGRLSSWATSPSTTRNRAGWTRTRPCCRTVEVEGQQALQNGRWSAIGADWPLAAVQSRGTKRPSATRAIGDRPELRRPHSRRRLSVAYAVGSTRSPIAKNSLRNLRSGAACRIYGCRRRTVRLPDFGGGVGGPRKTELESLRDARQSASDPIGLIGPISRLCCSAERQLIALGHCTSLRRVRRLPASNIYVDSMGRPHATRRGNRSAAAVVLGPGTMHGRCSFFLSQRHHEQPPCALCHLCRQERQAAGGLVEIANEQVH